MAGINLVHSSVSIAYRSPACDVSARCVISAVAELVTLWRNELGQTNKKAASALADPVSYPNLFGDFDLVRGVAGGPFQR